MHISSIRTVIAVLAISSLAFAQATYTTFGTGCAGSVAGACNINSNGSATTCSGNIGSFTNIYALRVPNSAPVLVINGFELLSQTVGASPISLNVAILNSTAAGNTGAVFAGTAGVISIGITNGWHRYQLATPLVITTGKDFFIQVAGNANVRFPVAYPGTTSEHYVKTSAAAAFAGPFKVVRWGWRVNCAGPNLVPRLHNEPKVFLDSNGAATTSSGGVGGFRNIYALPVANAAPVLEIDGFDLLSQAVTVPLVNLNVAILDSIAGRPGPTLATGVMNIGSTNGWHRFRLAKPLVIKTGRMFFIEVVGSTAIRFPVTLSGTVTPHFLRTPGSTVYTGGPFKVIKWAWRVNCPDVPKIGTTMSVELSDARANAVAILGLGFSKTFLQSPGGPLGLPLSLAGIGAPGCSLLSSLAVTLQGQTNNAGGVPFQVQIPNVVKLRGLHFYNQCFVLDPVNPLGLVVSNGGDGMIW